MDNIDFVREFLLAVKFELIRYRTAATIIAVAVLLSVALIGLSWNDQYVSRATLEIDDSNIIQPLLEGRAEFSRDNRVEEAKQTIVSRQLLELVAKELGYIDDESPGEEIATVITILRNNILVESDPTQNNVFFVSYYSSDPAIAFETVNVIVSQLVNYHRRAREAEGQEAYSFIASRAEVYKKRLEAAEERLAKFKSEKLDLDESTVQSKINELQDEIQELELQIRENRTIATTTRRQLDSEGDYLDAQSRIFELRQQKTPLERQLADLRTQFKESYPDVVSLKGQIAELDYQINRIASEKGIVPTTGGRGELRAESNPELLFDNLRAQLTEAERNLSAQNDRLSSLQVLLEAQRGKMEVVAANQAELAELRRDYNVTRDIYEETLNTRQNAELSVAITEEGLGLAYVVKEPPIFPLKPTGLVLWHFLAVAPILAIGAPIGMIFALILLDPRVRIVSSMEVEDLGFGEGGLITVSPHCHSAFSQQILRKDILVLAAIAGTAVAIFIALSVSGLQS